MSSGLIALGFVADDGDRFGLFAGAVLPAILLLGWFTFARLVQVGVESLRYLVRIQRIRRWYGDVVPAGSVWFADLAAGAGADGESDEAADAVRSMGMRPSGRQMLYTIATMVGALNSLVLGVAVTLAVRGADLLPLPWAAALGSWRPCWHSRRTSATSAGSSPGASSRSPGARRQPAGGPSSRRASRCASRISSR